MTGKQLSTRVQKELKELQAASSDDVLNPRVTGEQRGGVKETKTKVKSTAEKLDEQSKQAAEQRRQQFQSTRQIHTPKSGSQSVPASPKVPAEDLGRAVVRGVSQGPQVASSGARHLPAESFKSPAQKGGRVGAGTPPQAEREELSPRKLEAEMDLDIDTPTGPQGDTAEVTCPEKQWWEGGGNEEKGRKSEEKEESEVLKQLAALTLRFDKLATKEDLTALETKVVTEVRAEVKKEVQQAKKELKAEVKQEVLKEIGGNSAGTQGGGTSKETEELWRLLDRSDPAKRKVAFKGFADSVSEQKRFDKLQKALAELSETVTAAQLEAVTGGPRGQKKLTPVVLVDFGTEKKAQDFVKKYKNSGVSAAGCSLGVVHARTELNGKRNTVLRKAAEAVKASSAAKDKTVETLFGNDRQVKVNGEVVFQQNKAGVSGYFLGAYSDLPLP